MRILDVQQTLRVFITDGMESQVIRQSFKPHEPVNYDLLALKCARILRNVCLDDAEDPSETSQEVAKFVCRQKCSFWAGIISRSMTKMTFLKIFLPILVDHIAKSPPNIKVCIALFDSISGMLPLPDSPDYSLQCSHQLVSSLVRLLNSDISPIIRDLARNLIHDLVHQSPCFPVFHDIIDSSPSDFERVTIMRKLLSNLYSALDKPDLFPIHGSPSASSSFQWRQSSEMVSTMFRQMTLMNQSWLFLSNLTCLSPRSLKNIDIFEDHVVSTIMRLVCNHHPDPKLLDLFTRAVQSVLVFYLGMHNIDHTQLFLKLRNKIITTPQEIINREDLMFFVQHFASQIYMTTVIPDDTYRAVYDLLKFLFPPDSPNWQIPSAMDDNYCRRYSICETLAVLDGFSISKNAEFDLKFSSFEDVERSIDSLLAKKEEFPLLDRRLVVLANSEFRREKSLFAGYYNSVIDVFNHSTSTEKQLSSLLPVRWAHHKALQVSFIDNWNPSIRSRMLVFCHNTVKSYIDNPKQPLPSLSFLETYQRLLSFVDLSVLGSKFVANQMSKVGHHCSLHPVFHSLLELITYRMHFMLPQYRVFLVGVFQSIISKQVTANLQLNQSLETFILRAFLSLKCWETHHTMSRLCEDSNYLATTNLLSADSPELNTIVCMQLSAIIRINGGTRVGWVTLFSKNLAGFPHCFTRLQLGSLQNALSGVLANSAPSPLDVISRGNDIMKALNELNNLPHDKVLVHYFTSQRRNYLFMCYCWRVLLSGNLIQRPSFVNDVFSSINDFPSYNSLIRCFTDFVVYKFLTTPDSSHIHMLDCLESLLWDMHICTIDKFVLFLIFRPLEDQEAIKTQFSVAVRVIMRSKHLLSRMEFVSANIEGPHWWTDNHKDFQRRYCETFSDCLSPDCFDYSSESTFCSFPLLFSNPCLRINPVINVLLLRLLPHSWCEEFIDPLLSHVRPILGLQEHVISHLYTTLYLFNSSMSHALKRSIVSNYLNGLLVLGRKDVSLTPWGRLYLIDGLDFVPVSPFYPYLYSRLWSVINFEDVDRLTLLDWRYHEFPNPQAYFIHFTCLELMALPLTPSTVVDNLVWVALNPSYPPTSPAVPMSARANIFGIIMSSLPDCFVSPFYDTLRVMLSHEDGSYWGADLDEGVVSLAYSFFQHSSDDRLFEIIEFIDDRLPLTSDRQFVNLLMLVSPFLPRFNTILLRGDVATQAILPLITALYKSFLSVDHSVDEHPLLNPICDFFYHVEETYFRDSEGVHKKIISDFGPTVYESLKSLL